MLKNFIKKPQNSNEQGFTIVEVLVASFIFSIIAIGISSIFIGILQNERRAFAAQKIEENAMFVLEMLARDIRVSKIQDQEDPNCGLLVLTITHPVKGNIIYAVSSGVVQKTEGGITVDISSSEINFTRMNFCVRGSGTNDQKQTVVTIIASIQNRTGKETIKFDIQTAVSSRSVETEFLQ